MNASAQPQVTITFRCTTSDEETAKVFELRALAARLHWDRFGLERDEQGYHGIFRLSQGLFDADGGELLVWLSEQELVTDILVHEPGAA